MTLRQRSRNPKSGGISHLFRDDNKILRPKQRLLLLLLLSCSVLGIRHLCNKKAALGGHNRSAQTVQPPSFSPSSSALGAIVFLAPQRYEDSIWDIDRFCMLLRAIRSVDQHLNSHFGPYPIYVLVAKDHALDPRQKDGLYSEADRSLIRRWAPKSQVTFVEVNMYSSDALEPGTTREQILQWRQGQDGAVAGRDLGYTSMCRLWSGRLQGMSFLDGYQYYMRMDDDSLLIRQMAFDPFQRMLQQNLTYAYRRETFDRWGIRRLWQVSKPYLNTTSGSQLPFVDGVKYYGRQPYNNFHITRVDFWRKRPWQDLWKDFNENHLFFKYRVGDANVHAIAVMLMANTEFQKWRDMPYVHNSNDYPSWGRDKSWREECQREYALLGQQS